jgi:hypothetical protein
MGIPEKINLDDNFSPLKTIGESRRKNGYLLGNLTPLANN